MRLAKRDDIDLWFEDECHFQQHGSRCAMWIHSEIKDPIVLHAPTRKHIGVFGAVRVADGTLVSERASTFDAVSFHGFLKRLFRRHRKGIKMVVIVDNARWHHAKLLIPWLTKHKRILQLLFLPPYSPDLNSIERVWKLTRRLCTHNQYFPEIEQLIEIVFQQFHAWRKPNDTLRRLCAII
jgi:transposase